MKNHPMMIELPVDMAVELTARAKKRLTSRAAYVRSILQRELAGEPPR